jgi:hypothetical protein
LARNEQKERNTSWPILTATEREQPFHAARTDLPFGNNSSFNDTGVAHSAWGDAWEDS